MSTFVTIDEFPADETRLLRDTFFALADGIHASEDVLSAIDRVEFVERLLGKDVCSRLGIYRLPADFLLSVVMPVYNEAETVAKVIERVRQVELPCEIIIVDDGSTDGTREFLAELSESDDSANNDLIVLFHERNAGKGAALKTGFSKARGDAVVIQDADLEYDPQDFRRLLQPIVENRADVVYGSRFSRRSSPVSPRWHRSGNRLITTLSNIATGQKFTDVETCYKMIRRKFLERITDSLREKGFGIEVEITAKLAKMKDVRLCERPISYVKRTYAEGKKIGVRDAVRAMWCIMRY